MGGGEFGDSMELESEAAVVVVLLPVSERAGFLSDPSFEIKYAVEKRL